MTVMKERRLAAGMTQRELAEAAKVSTRNIEHWESGGIWGARFESVIRVADALQLMAEQLVTYEYDEALMVQEDE